MRARPPAAAGAASRTPSADALMFPNPPASGADLSFTSLQKPRNVTQEFGRKATVLGFPGRRFHDLRGSHETVLPVHVVVARCGHDPAVLLRDYAKRTKKADTSAAKVISKPSKGALT
jgi:integrase